MIDWLTHPEPIWLTLVWVLLWGVTFAAWVISGRFWRNLVERKSELIQRQGDMIDRYQRRYEGRPW